ncbi:MalY/PatB family protein [Cytobacillus solani]|uniref:cysteine-S-conjugate beta-lyase n=1 Tax=Cytobacillus solani TaxID=1637975 RepID=A0A0Q3VJK4_9BACI|nr:PatB family C-S lyase [Cytobacillus solani]KOP80073.1 cystathionine beta-lyase [Bacillus sp. FJAT-21945]KQL21042.1 cystathionine beta-lyase [Cytobacillus solani]USK54291.1 PatB family C-S lyase [Cytobacillus solani]
MNMYDFNQKMNREHTSSVKWGLTKQIFGADDVLPMWVADMDFSPPNEVKEAIQARVDHGIYGYTFSPPSTTEAIQQWLNKRHGWEINHSWVLYSTGVVPTISIAIEAFTAPGDKVMLQSPVYTPFFEMIEKNKRKLVNTPLKLINNRYEIDFTVFEDHLKDGVKLFLLCNPHNPSGRVWTKEELTRVGELCHQYNCLILSDEIHSDLILKNKHVPIASLDETFKEITVTCIAPSKTFNLAGLQASAVIIPNKQLRKAFKDVQERQGFFSLSTFGIIGMEAAYRSGEQWLEELLAYLKENVKTVKEYIDAHIPGISVMEPEGSYLIWLNCQALQLSDDEIKDQLLIKGKLALEPGTKYGPGGEGFVRMNIACPKEVVLEGLERLKKAFE